MRGNRSTCLQPAPSAPSSLIGRTGQESITITLDRYGHLLPGNETEAAQLLDSWLKNATRRR